MDASLNARWQRLVQTLQDRLQSLEARGLQQTDEIREKLTAFYALPAPADEQEYTERRCTASELTFWAK